MTPVGLAGPLRILGEHAQGDFIVPGDDRTTEGAREARASRAMRVLGSAGGVTCTVDRARILWEMGTGVLQRAEDADAAEPRGGDAREEERASPASANGWTC